MIAGLLGQTRPRKSAASGCRAFVRGEAMSRDFPDWINPWTAAQGNRRFAGTVPLRRMKRLAPSLYSRAGTEGDETEGAGTRAGAGVGNDVGRGQAAFEARFALDSERRPVIELEVRAELELLCQASLEPYLHEIERQSTLGVVESDLDVERLPPHYEPVFAENGRLALATLVEDELILGLPAVPRNPDVGALRFSTDPGNAPEAGRSTGGRAEDRLAKDRQAEDAPENQTSAGGDAAREQGRPNPFAVLKGKVGRPTENDT
jgi:uncharacterized protein